MPNDVYDRHVSIRNWQFYFNVAVPWGSDPSINTLCIPIPSSSHFIHSLLPNNTLLFIFFFQSIKLTKTIMPTPTPNGGEFNLPPKHTPQQSRDIPPFFSSSYPITLKVFIITHNNNYTHHFHCSFFLLLWKTINTNLLS